MSVNEARILHRINEVQSAVTSLNQGVIQVSGQVAHVGQRAEETRNDLQQLARDFADFVKRSERIANIQRAETRVGVVEAQLENQFGHHNVVRRFATGLLQGFDVGLVSEETVRAVSEQLMVQNPRYWLAPVLVALGAWASDDQELCERGIQEGFRRSPDRTSLFLALVLRRQGRRDSSVRWLRQYLAAQDPHALGRNFAVILECISQGAFGPSGVEIVQERLDAWRAQLLTDEDRQQAQVGRWRAEMDRHVGPSAQPNFPRLAEVSPQWPQMDAALSHAAAHGALITKYAALAAEEITPQDRIEDAVDDILDRLVREFDEEELPLRREHAEHHAVIRNGGDLDAARRDLDSDLIALEQKLDYLTIQSESALNPGKIGVSRATQRMAVSSCHDWFARAHATFCGDYRQGLPTDVQAVFETTHNTAGVVFKLPRWTGSFTRPMPELEADLAGHWDRASRPFIDGLAYNWGRKVIAPVVVLLLALLILVPTAGVAGLIITMIGGGIWFLVLYIQSQAAAKLQDAVRELLARGKQDSLQQLRGAGAELIDWTSAFRREDSREPQVRALIGDLATAGAAASPYERRVADPGAQSGA
jgi:hypothetical protein